MSKVFLSYCHKDEQHKEDLLKFLNPLINETHIEIWNDEQLDPGDDWHKEIQEKLKEYDKVVAIITPNFLASYYINEYEVGPAIENDTHRVIPLIVETCSWQRTRLKQYNALPKNGNAVQEWSNKNRAWTEIAESLADGLDSIEEKEKVLVKQAAQDGQEKKLELNEATKKWLEELDLPFNHPNATVLTLSDIFIPPHVRSITEDASDLNNIIEAFSEDLPKQKIIYGEEQSGKTTLAKKIFSEKLEKGRIPIYLNGTDIRNKNINTWLDKALQSEYYNSDYNVENMNDISIVIDDFGSCGLNRAALNAILSDLYHNFESVDLISSDRFRYVSLDLEASEFFKEYEILPLGKKKRQELVEAWISAGKKDEIIEEELYGRADQLMDRLDSIVLRNVVPPLPPYILTILSLASVNSGKEMELTAHGHCYQYLVYQALEKSNISPKELDKYMNLLTQMSGWIYGRNSLDSKGVKAFFDWYNQIYLPVEDQNPIQMLEQCLLLEEGQNGWQFKHPYVYYFFAARWIAENLYSTSFKEETISYLLENLHKQECANILIFVTHHSNSVEVLEDIEYTLMGQFEEEPVTWLERNEIDFIEEFIKEIPELVMEKREVKEGRRVKAEQEEKAENKAEELEEIVEELSPNDLLAQVTKFLKSMELVGQVVRGRAASLPRDRLFELIKESEFTGLRFLHYFLSISEIGKEEVLRSIEEVLSENPNLTNKEVEVEAKNSYLLLTYGVIFGIINKISSSVGCTEADVIYDDMENQFPRPAIQLIRFAMELQHKKRLDIERVKDLSKEFKDNIACFKILKELVVQHTYMFPVEYYKKQQIADALDIPLEYQYRSQLESGGR
ncbi:TIR domain-containing protein [Thiohalorhabdus denitrificans]|uniref:ATPase n=1 Tax=Thiohalorhabdus denitrificans TaxID=381306 RepID=A0A1G5HWV7_9GAMM|nr:TIR domain-containing protein [Thiohalorhabdus denitrificans]SCY68243.1 ATPase [Thiohalorhabdus denitrificans]